MRPTNLSSPALANNRRVLQICMLFTGFLGIAVILGWHARIQILTTVFPGFATMKFNTALALLLGALAVFELDRHRPESRQASIIATLCGTIVSLIGLAAVIEYGWSVNLHVDQLFCDQSFDPTRQTFPGRMSVVTGFNLVCIGCSLIALGLRRGEGAAHILAMMAFVTGFTAVLGYFYGATSLYAAGHDTAMALHTGLGFIAISTAILCLRPNQGIIGMLNLSGVSGTVARRFVPLAIVAPVVIGGIGVWAQHQGFFETETGVAVYCLTIIFTFIFFIGWNTTHLVRVEHSLRESAGRYEFLADSMPQIIWTATPDGKTDYHNRAWFEYTGLSSDAPHAGWKAVLHPDDIETCRERWARALLDRKSHEVEFRLKRASDGMYRWHLGRTQPMHDHEGVITQWVGTCTDIDDQKRAKEQLEQRVAERTSELAAVQMRIQEVLDAATRVSIIATTLEGVITIFNKGAERMLGYTASELVGKQTPSALHLRSEVEARGAELSRELGRPIDGFEVFVAHARQGQFEECDWTYVRKDGSTLQVRLAVTATCDANGEINGFLGVATDITERKLYEERLRETKELAESANKAKSEFLANMSHEIRTPLNGIIGLTDLTLETRLTSTQRDYLDMVKNSADSLLALVNDLLDFAKIESGKLVLENRSFDLSDMIAKTLGPVRMRAEAKGLRLQTDAGPDIPPHIMGDSLRLRQVLVNLLDNAIKFTREGSVTLELRVMANDELQFSVTDTGIGIPPDKQRLIFESFSQADNSITRRYGGTGLGLAISSELVRLMGGTISVESEPGRGSTFRFSIKAPAAEGVPRPHLGSDNLKAAEPSAHALHLLVVEDNIINQSVASGILGKLGYRVSTASNGCEAVACVQSCSYDAILMDVQMPEMDGLTATSRIRQWEKGQGKHTPIVAMTAHAGEDDRARCLSAGMDDYLTKPISMHKVATALNSLLTIQEDAVKAPIKAPATPCFSAEDLFDRLERDPELYERVAETVRKTTPVSMRQLKELVADGDHVGAARLAHSIRGALANIGAAKGAEIAAKLEELAQNKLFHGTENLLDELKDELDCVYTELGTKHPTNS